MSTLLYFGRKALPYLVAIAAVFGVLWFTYERGVSDENERRVAEVQALNAQHVADIKTIGEANALALAAAQRTAREKEQADAQAMAELDQKHFKELNDAKAEAQRTIDGLRSGAVRLRKQFTCPAASAGSAASGVPGTSTSTGMGDGAAERGFGVEDALAVVRAADEGDRWASQLLACQAIVRRDRGQ